MRRLIMLLIAITLSGCYSWQRDGAGPEQVTRDYRECDYEGQKAAAGNPSVIMWAANSAEIRSLCMKARGYTMKEVRQ